MLFSESYPFYQMANPAVLEQQAKRELGSKASEGGLELDPAGSAVARRHLMTRMIDKVKDKKWELIKLHYTKIIWPETEATWKAAHKNGQCCDGHRNSILADGPVPP